MGFAVPASPSFHAIYFRLEGIQRRRLPMCPHLAERKGFGFRIDADEGDQIRVPFVEFGLPASRNNSTRPFDVGEPSRQHVQRRAEDELAGIEDLGLFPAHLHILADDFPFDCP